MLDHTKVIKKLYACAQDLFVDYSYERELMRMVWNVIAYDTMLYNKIISCGSNDHTISSWQGKLAEVISVEGASKNYTAIAVDGSQIYPDKHQGTSCFLINMGLVIFSYGSDNTMVQLNTEPFIFSGDEYASLINRISHDLVNLVREQMEFESAACCDTRLNGNQQQALIFFDGPLVFWFLENKDQAVKDYFFFSYMKALKTLYEKKIPYIGYLSMSHSQDLSLILAASFPVLEHYIHKDMPMYDVIYAVCAASDDYKNALIKHLTDVVICGWFLKPYERTILFQSNHTICKQYPNELRPYFFYLHIGQEIARIEIPCWIAHKPELLDWICSTIIDQAHKGMGYPVCLAEAHEQAVVKSADREFFYHILRKVGMTHKKRFILSPKSIKKRGIGI
jgi:hypothetical protein